MPVSTDTMTSPNSEASGGPGNPTPTPATQKTPVGEEEGDKSLGKDFEKDKSDPPVDTDNALDDGPLDTKQLMQAIN